MKNRGVNLIVVLLLAIAMFATVGTAQGDIKYVLTMFHFNIQYVCGGLEGFVPFGEVPSWELNDREVEDTIVKESFEPILDVFLAHPDWAVTLEMQGYFLDVLADRHADVLTKLRTLADAGQAELVSFHYSDQLFIAYPYEDWRRSVEQTIATFEKYDLPLSGTVFCQEGQASPAMAAAMEEYGYETMVWPKNLWKYQFGEFDADPYYDFGNIKLIAGAKGVNDPVNGVYTNWKFFDDGEKLATGDWDPYFPWFFKYNADAVNEWVDELQTLYDDGYVIGTIEDYIADLESASVPTSTLPDLMEGTWQPASTDGTHRWMGGAGNIWFLQERDNYVRTLCALGHRELVAAETIADQAGIDVSDKMAEAWRLLALGQVTDATGINPFGGEIQYGIAYVSEAMRIAREVIEQSKEALGYDNVAIDTLANSVSEGQEQDETGDSATAPVEVNLYAPGRQLTETWTQISDSPQVYKYVIDFTAGESILHRLVQITFTGEAGPIIYSPGLNDEQIVSKDRSQYVFDHFYLPLSNGLIGLGNDWFIIKDQAFVHLAGQVFTDSPDIMFVDEVAGQYETMRYVFYLVQGQSDALDLAVSLNIWPTLYR